MRAFPEHLHFFFPEIKMNEVVHGLGVRRRSMMAISWKLDIGVIFKDGCTEKHGPRRCLWVLSMKIAAVALP